MPEMLNSWNGSNWKFVLLIFLVVLGAVVLTSGCTSTGTLKDTRVPGSPGIPGSNGTPGNSPVNDTVTVAHDSHLQAKSYDYEAAMQQLPEVSTGVMKQSEIDRYRVLLGKLDAKDPGAARWVAGMGLFAEDRIISHDEMAFVDTVATKDDPLRILVTPWIRDGIGSQEAGWAANVSFPTGEYGYLTDDLQKIEAVRGPADPAAKEKLKSIIKDSETDYELRKGLCIIDEYGVPRKDGFNYQIPAYNTQLGVLLDLLKNSDISPEYYRLALAARHRLRGGRDHRGQQCQGQSHGLCERHGCVHQGNRQQDTGKGRQLAGKGLPAGGGHRTAVGCGRHNAPVSLVT